MSVLYLMNVLCHVQSHHYLVCYPQINFHDWPSKLDAITPSLLSVDSLRLKIKCHDAGYQISHHDDHYLVCYLLIVPD